MIVRVHNRIIAKFATQNFDRAIGNHLIRVHVKADACPGLEHIHYKFLVPFPLLHLLRSLNNRVSTLFVQQTERFICLCRSLLDHAEGANQGGMCPHA